MIALDSSALVAIAVLEPEAEDFVNLIAVQPCIVGTPTVLETSMVVRDRSGDEGIAVLERILARKEIRVLPFDLIHLTLARQAFGKYGKGQGHSAQLNFGDCMAYAVAKRENVPLLYKGNDFTQTDIEPAFP